jgi:hypothetical protein
MSIEDSYLQHFTRLRSFAKNPQLRTFAACWQGDCVSAETTTCSTQPVEQEPAWQLGNTAPTTRKGSLTTSFTIGAWQLPLLQS